LYMHIVAYVSSQVSQHSYTQLGPESLAHCVSSHFNVACWPNTSLDNSIV